MVKSQKFSLVLVALVFLFGCAAFAQVNTGTISGTVKDSSGAILPGAKVVVLNEDTGVSRIVETDAAGRYSAPSLNLGNYRVTASAAGFDGASRTGILLTVGREAVVDFQMTVGTVTQTVEVTGEAPLVNTTVSSTAGLVAEQEVKDLPLNGRSFDQLLTLNTGTANTTSTRSGGVGNYFSISGRRPDENRFILNGVDYPGTDNNGDAFMPTGASGQLLGVDAVREFNVVQDTYGAQYGKYAGGQISVVTSSGTNRVHGDAFEFLRNSDLDSRNFFDYPIGERIPPFKRNQFGGALGGPIKKDKAFFFANYEGFRQRLGVSDVSIVPDAQARIGNLPTGPGGTYVTPANLVPGMLPYIQDFWPAPNGQELLSGAGLPTGLAYDYANPPQQIREDFGLARFDYVASASDSFSASILHDNGEIQTPGAENPTLVATTPQVNTVASMQETHIFSPSLLNVATLGFGRTYQLSGTAPGPGGYSIPASLDFLTGGGPGSITIGGGAIASVAASVTGAGGGRPVNTTKNLFTWADDVHLTKGNHSLSLGVWIQRIQANTMGAAADTSGGLAFSTVATMLADNPSSFLIAPTIDLLGFRTTQAAWYVQDEIRLRSNFTLSLGLRDEMTNGFNEAHGRASNYLYNSAGIIEEDPHVGPSALTQNNAIALWQPRVGLAWDPTGSGKWSVRAGFGIMNDLEDNLGYKTNANYPYAGQFSLTGPILPQIPIPIGEPLPPPCNAVLQAAHANCGIYKADGVEPNMHTPTVQEWSFTIQRQLASELMMQLGYVGSQSYHLVTYLDTNAIQPAVCASAQGCAAGGTKGAVSVVPQGTTYIPPGTLPNPYVSFTQPWFFSGVSSYHALNASLVKRFSHGSSFKVNYTFGKILDTNSALNTRQATNEPGTVLDPYDLALSKGLASYDLQQQFNANFTYELPFGNGRRFASGAGGVLDKVIGGWQWNGILTAQCGFPITPTAGSNQSGDGDGSNPDVPNWNPAFTGPVVTGNIHQWYNPAAFLLPTAGTFGDVSRGSFQGPGLFGLDTSLFKDIRIKEGMSLQFRAEAFNILNRANFGTPSLPVFSAGAVAASAGAVTATSTTSRQIQFALKLKF